jgi:hypothetical protein
VALPLEVLVEIQIEQMLEQHGIREDNHVQNRKVYDRVVVMTATNVVLEVL